jgi:hypothetical protein
VEQLAAEVPVVQGLAGVEALVALKPHKAGVNRAGQRLREAGLANARVAFEEQRALEFDRQVAGRGEALVGEVPGRLQRSGERCWRIGDRKLTGHLPTIRPLGA